MNATQYNQAVNNVRMHLRAIQFDTPGSVMDWMVDQCSAITAENVFAVFGKMKKDDLIFERAGYVCLPEYAEELA
jgi:hypothetical protein